MFSNLKNTFNKQLQQ